MLAFLIVLTLLVVVYLVVADLLRRRSNSLLYDGIAWASGWVPVFGHGLAFGADPEKFISSQCERLGNKPFVMQVFNLVLCVLSSSKACEEFSKLTNAEASFVGAGVELLAFKNAFPPIVLQSRFRST
jgi:hypothetical protein